MARRIDDPETLAHGIHGYILGHHSPDGDSQERLIGVGIFLLLGVMIAYMLVREGVLRSLHVRDDVRGDAELWSLLPTDQW